MHESYGRDLDLNLLRVFVVVAHTRSVTRAAAQLYLTQPAVSAALRRLTRSVGEPLFVRSGRGLVLTQRGQRLFASARPLLEALVDAALSPPQFDPRTSERVLRIGLSDSMEGWLLPRLLHALREQAPRMRIISVPVQFRSVAEQLGSRAVDMALTVADQLPPAIKRAALPTTGFVCLFDPRHVQPKLPLRERDYLAHEHLIVSYNADLRGVIEDLLQKQRNVRCSVSSFSHVGALVSGSPLLATVPQSVAEQICSLYPELSTAALPFAMDGGGPELLWHTASDEDDACRFARELLLSLLREPARAPRRRKRDSASRAALAPR